MRERILAHGRLSDKNFELSINKGANKQRLI